MVADVVVRIKEGFDVFTVWIDYGHGRGDQLCISVPSGRHAAYPEAVERNRLERDRKIADHVTRLRRFHPDLTVQHTGPLPNLTTDRITQALTARAEATGDLRKDAEQELADAVGAANPGSTDREITAAACVLMFNADHTDRADC